MDAKGWFGVGGLVCVGVVVWGVVDGSIVGVRVCSVGLNGVDAIALRSAQVVCGLESSYQFVIHRAPTARR